jgi:hypothetical protein
MDDFNIELTLTATDGSLHNIQTLYCLAWVLASTYNPLHREQGHAAVTTRPEGGYGALVTHEPHISNVHLGEVVALMRQLGLPGRTPRVQARSGSGLGSQNIVLDLRIGTERGRLWLQMDYAGLEGEDVTPCVHMLTRLFELLGVSYLGRWVDPLYERAVTSEQATEASPTQKSASEKDRSMDFDTGRIRTTLEAWSPAVSDGMVEAVTGLIREAVESERQACLEATHAIELDYRDAAGIRVKRAVIEALEKRAGGTSTQ